MADFAEALGHMVSALVEWLVYKLPRGCLILFILALIAGVVLALVLIFAR